MDIFLRNVPDQANSKSLEKFLRKQLLPFGIEVFTCRKLKSRGCGVVTVLDTKKAQNFLACYEKSSYPNMTSSQHRFLNFMGRNIICAPSRTQPEEYLLKTLRQETKERTSHKAQKKLKPGPDPRADRQYQYRSVHCGVWDYQGSDLVFVPYADSLGTGWIKFGKKNLALVADSSGTGGLIYRLDISYSAVSSITIGDSQEPSVTLTLLEAPKVYRQTDPDLASLFGGLGLLGNVAATPKKIRVPGLWEYEASAISRCFVYRINIFQPRQIHDIDKMLQGGQEMPANIRWPTSTLTPTFAISKKMDQLIKCLHQQYFELDFRVQFQVQRLAQNGVMCPDLALQLLPRILQLSSQSGGVAAAEALQYLYRQVPYAGPSTDAAASTVDYFWEQLLKYDKMSRREAARSLLFRQNHPHIIFIHRAMVTPAGIYLRGPEPETSNRVLRTYAYYNDYFIRVTFCEEDGDPMRFDRSVSLDRIFHSRFKSVLENGFRIAGRQFAFLGFSHSSLRDQTCWFMAPFEHDGRVFDANTVIAELGDFSSIRSPAKCAARIGQAFSTTDGAVKISQHYVHMIPDVERNGRTFSDGVGTISTEILAMLWRDYVPARISKPTVYQIRFAGAKGMISLDIRQKGKVLSLRESMIKFTGSAALDIEICGSASRPLPLYLNRQFIKIMEDLGVAPDTFLQLQNDAVERLRRTTLSAVNAANFLERENVGKICQIPWLIRKFHSLGFDFAEDPFLRQVVELAVLSQLRDLKHRSRIFVEHGVTLYGIMDETDTLPEGNIYCSTNKHVILGKVSITRAPALHPGDIQIAEAVDVPEDSPLSHLHNCVVFSQRGSRDLPSQLSGGDLDGDLFNVIYDPRLLPAFVVEPADYPRVIPKDIGRTVTRTDMTDFFIDFMENDQLGRIALLHRQLADRKHEGTQHPDCKILAELHSTAVDFSKTGIPVDLSKLPKYDRYRPDFMAPGPRVTIEKDFCNVADSAPLNIAEDEEDPVEALDPDTPSYRYYESQMVLGQLYRAIDEKNFLAQLQKQARAVEESFRIGETLIHRVWTYVQRQSFGIQWHHYREWAYDIREAYETQVIETMYQYSPSSVLISEVEVFVGTLLGKGGGAQNKRLREMSTSMKEQFERDIAFTINCIVHGSDDSCKGGEDEALERSIACLDVAMEESPATWDVVKRLESFRYVTVGICLAQLERLHGNTAFHLPL